MALPDLGEPLTGRYPIPDGDARLFTGGVSIQHGGGELLAGFAFPSLGRPSIVSLEPPAPVFEKNTIHFDAAGGDPARLGRLIRDALAGRLALAATGQPATQIALALGDASHDGGPLHQVEVVTPALAERQLYDVALLTDGGQWRTVAPHAVYFRRAWTDFGIAHITDLHVAKRIDRFRGLLERADRSEAARRLYNWNDRFRGFVRYANYLHSIGVLDVVLSTGDQYDYIYEDGEDPALGGNASFFRALILGQAPGPDFLDVEELRVPIFLTTGNHDYRKHAYKLIFDLRLGGSVAGVDLTAVKNFKAYNLGEEDARLLERRLHAKPDLPPPYNRMNEDLDADEAGRMVEVDRQLQSHRQFLSDKVSYVVALGPHRIAMIDSGPDTGMITSVLDGLRQAIGRASEDEDTFVAGSPNSEGVSGDELRMVTDALAGMSEPGLFIVGIHAPLVNPDNEEYPYFLRQTQRPVQTAQAAAFLRRIAPSLNPAEAIENTHPTWFPGPNDHRQPAFIKRVDRNDRLDFAVSRGQADELIEALVGGSARPADLVLSGHTHYLNEFSVRRMHTGELAFYMDHYTESPANYYPTRFCTEFAPGIPSTGLSFDKTSVEVMPGAAPDGAPAAVGDSPLKYDLHVPPYADPLNASDDPAAWWGRHRPVLLQTTALGPFKVLHFLSGFRVFSVRNNVIARSNYVSIARLEAHGYRLGWEEATLPDTPGPGQARWRSVSEGGTIPGARIAAIPRGDRITVVVAGTSGEIYACDGSYQRGWGLWQTVSQGSTIPGGPVTAVPFAGRIALFLADVGGGVYTCLGSYGAWGPWLNVSEGGTIPGGQITAVPHNDRITIFLADPGGGIYVNSGRDGSWGPWRNVSEGSSTPGAPLAAVMMNGKVTLVLADPAGGIYATAGTYDGGWGPWRSVAEGSTVPRGHVTAVAAGSKIRLFVADANGGVYVITGSYEGGWGSWASVSEGSTMPGAPIGASLAGDRISLFLADRGGGVYSSVLPANGGPGPWKNVSEGVTRPGGFVTAAVSDDGITAFLADPAGGIYARLVT